MNGNGGYDGPREAIRQLERRADVNDREHALFHQTIGALNATLAEIRSDLKAQKERAGERKEEVDQSFSAVNEKLDKWSGRQWALMGVVIAFALAAIGNLLVLLSQRGSP
jgi:hypothetical protein